MDIDTRNEGKGMRIENTIKNLVELIWDDDYDTDNVVLAIVLIMPDSMMRQLKQLVEGPIWDGSVISKLDRDRLHKAGLCVSVCCSGDSGYNAAVPFSIPIVVTYDERNKESNIA